ncbi:MAG: hypothetical protein K2V38_12585 [Gemmataceae bacterium]|nr:hypothetical protein [Gemmataceae bacterium]
MPRKPAKPQSAAQAKPKKSAKAATKVPKGKAKSSAVTAAKKLFIQGLRIRRELVPAAELGPHPRDGVTHIEKPNGEIERVAFSTV